VPRLLVAFAQDTREAEVLDEGLEFRPGVIPTNKVQSPILSKVTCQDVVMIVLKDTHSEFSRNSVDQGNIDAFVEPKKTISVDGPT
jgi:hypothetical protein